VTRKQRILLFGGLAIALVITLIFGIRLVRRFVDRPTNEPIREWMSVPYIAHSYRVPPRVLFDALGLPDPDQPRDMRPLREIARAQNKNVSDLITTLQAAIETERNTRRPGGDKPEPPPPSIEPTPALTPTKSSTGS